MSLPDPEQRDAVQPVRDEVTRASNLERAGRHAVGLQRARAALEHARALEWPTLVAQASVSVGRLLVRADAVAEAEGALEDAYFEASIGGAHHTAVDAALALTFVVGYRAHRHADGRRWGRLADVALTSLPDADGLRRAILLEHLAAIDMADETFEHARDRYEQSLAIVERVLGPEHPDVAHSLTQLAGALRPLGRHDQAREHLERALAIQDRTLGSDHPRIAATLTNLAHVYGDLGRDAEATARLERALTIQERVHGPDHSSVATATINLANVHLAHGAYDDAIERYERAVAILERSLGPDHVDLADGLSNLASAHLARGDLDQALALQTRALAIQETALGAEHPAVARRLANLAAIHQAKGDLERAGTAHERALAIIEQHLPPNHPDLALALYNLATVRFSARAYDEAWALHERALTLMEGVYGAEHPEVAFPLVALAEIALEQGRPDAALRLAERGVRIREQAHVPSEHLAMARFVLAKARWERPEDRGDDRASALALAQQAREELAKVGDGSASLLAEVDAWLDEHPPAQPAR